MSAATRSHPCLACGACCATYRVSFYWGELQGAGGTVPDALAEQVAPFLAAMAGTNRAEPRCGALVGDVGGATRCAIYAERPTPCRELVASWEHGVADEKCDRARVRHGLPPLRPEDWTG